jgi:hypothetical protein
VRSDLAVAETGERVDIRAQDGGSPPTRPPEEGLLGAAQGCGTCSEMYAVSWYTSFSGTGRNILAGPYVTML